MTESLLKEGGNERERRGEESDVLEAAEPSLNVSRVWLYRYVWIYA